MTVSAQALFAEVDEIIAQLRRTQLANVAKAASLIAGRIRDGGVVHVFGAGHSRAFAMELAGRAGGLACVHAIGLEEVAQAEGRKGLSINLPELERAPETAHKLLGLCRLEPNDAWIIVSNSGRNGCPVELALEVKRLGMPVIAVTSLAHSTATTSRHPSGKRLYELADVVIDNCAPYGDTLLEVEGTPLRACAGSSIAGAYIAQALTAEIVGRLLEWGKVPPLFISANVDGSDEHNAAVQQRYQGRV